MRTTNNEECAGCNSIKGQVKRQTDRRASSSCRAKMEQSIEENDERRSCCFVASHSCRICAVDVDLPRPRRRIEANQTVDESERETSRMKDSQQKCCVVNTTNRSEEPNEDQFLVDDDRGRWQYTALRPSFTCIRAVTKLMLVLFLFAGLPCPSCANGARHQQSWGRPYRQNGRKTRAQKQQEQLDFIKAMRQVEEEKNLQESRRRLTQRLLNKAKFVPTAATAAKASPQKQQQSRSNPQRGVKLADAATTTEQSSSNIEVNQEQLSSSTVTSQTQKQEQAQPGNERKLGNNNNNNNNNNNYQYYQDQDYIDGNNAQNNNNNANENNQNNNYADVDLSGYALKYTGCQNIHTWDDNLVGNGYQSPLAMNRFVMFRVCEADACSAYNKWGCNYNFGQYMIKMEDYLSIMADYHLEQYGRYCITCYNCMSMDYYKQQQQQDEQQQQGDDQVNNNNDDGGGGGQAVDDAYAAAANDDVAGDDNGGGDAVVYDDAYVDTNYSFGDDYWAGYRRYWYEPSYWNDDDANNNNGRRLDQDNYDYENQGNGAMNYYYGGNYYTDDVNAGDDNKYDDYYNVDQEDDHPWYADDDGKCMFEHVCSNFRYACRDYNPNSTFYEDYYACSAFAVGNNVGYLGPHCRSDGRTIGIGIYKDAMCSVYMGDEQDIEQFTGYEFDSSELQYYYDKSCISCSAIDGFSLVTDDALKATRDITYPLCSMLYENSGKCNRYFGAEDYNYEYSNQYSNEDQVCDYIESLVENNYDESGEIYMRNREFELSNWQDPHEYAKVVTGASPFQILFLIVSIGIFLSLLVYSCYLSKKLRHRMPWRPPTSVISPYATSASVAGGSIAAVSEAGRVSRVNSGIVAMRSRSNEGVSLYGESGRGSGVLSATSPPPFEFPTSLASTKPHSTTSAGSSMHPGTFA